MKSDSPARRVAGAPVELGTGQLDAAHHTRHVVVARPGTPLRPRTAGTLQELLAAVSAYTGVSVQRMQSRDRSRAAVRARRHVLVLGYEYLGWTLADTAAVLGLAARR